MYANEIIIINLEKIKSKCLPIYRLNFGTSSMFLKIYKDFTSFLHGKVFVMKLMGCHGNGLVLHRMDNSTLKYVQSVVECIGETFKHNMRLLCSSIQ